MALTFRAARPAAAGDVDVDGPLTRSADRLLLIGALAIGAQLLGPVGLVLIAVGLLRLRAAQRAGETDRPFAVTVFALFSLVDAATNTLGWSIDTFAHATHIGQTFMTGYGRLIDGAYYVHYNSTLLGGASGPGEKSWQIFCVFAVFPLRIAAAWAFLKLRRWGYDMMLVTCWAYVFFWFGYLVNIFGDFPHRMANTAGGVVGWWGFNIWYITPFVILPWMYAVNRGKWNR